LCTQPAACYRGRADCPYLSPAGDGLHLFHEIPNSNPAGSTVATNAPSYLLVREAGRLRVAATLPSICWKETPAPGERPLDAPLFAAGGKVGAGRVLVLADHSLFINEMLLP